jgi:hypothetical protein
MAFFSKSVSWTRDSVDFNGRSGFGGTMLFSENGFGITTWSELANATRRFLVLVRYSFHFQLSRLAEI